jgi:hypothetical protein
MRPIGPVAPSALKMTGPGLAQVWNQIPDDNRDKMV